MVNGTGTQAAILVPVCYPNSNNYYVPTFSTGTVYPAPAITGSPNWNGFGAWDVYDNLVTITSIGSSPFGIGTDNVNPLPIRATPMQFKVGRDYYYCPNIAGPDCEEYVDPLVPSTPEQNITIPDVPGGVYFKIIRHPRSGQITDVQVCGDLDYGEGVCTSLETRTDVFGEAIHNCTNLNGNQGLQECIIAGTGSPHTQNIVSGTITKVYPYCRAGEIKSTVAITTNNKFGFDCKTSSGGWHTD